MTEGAFRSVTVVGLGVMGGSVARAVLARLPGTPVFGIDPDPGCATMAARDGVEVLAGLEGLADAEVAGGVVVFAAPLDVTVKLVRETAATWGQAALATDVASLKHPVLAAAASPPAAAAAHGRMSSWARTPCAGRSARGMPRPGRTSSRAPMSGSVPNRSAYRQSRLRPGRNPIRLCTGMRLRGQPPSGRRWAAGPA